MKKPILTAAVAALVVAVGGATYAGAGDSGNAPAQAPPTRTVAPVTAPSETGYVPVTPCRLVDTKKAGGRIKSGGTRAFHARGTSLAAQGGHAGGCGIPAGATAITVTLTAFSATGTGTLVAYPGGTSTPAARSLSYRKGPATSAGTTTQLGQNPDFRVRVSRRTHVQVDVTGYYAPPMAAFVATAGSLEFTTGRVLDSTHSGVGQYIVTFDRDVSQCSFQVTPYAFNWPVAVGPQSGQPTQAHVYIHEQGASVAAHDTSFFIQATC